jgi:hypothetical protein
VTTDARHAAQVVIVVDVAVDALPGRIRVSTGQKKSSASVVKFGIQPVICAVAVFANRGELGGDVIRIRRLLEYGLVTGIARSRHGLEFAVGAAFMAAIAIDRGMSSSQREAIIVLLNIFNCDLPSPYGVTLFAIGA